MSKTELIKKDILVDLDLLSIDAAIKLLQNIKKKSAGRYRRIVLDVTWEQDIKGLQVLGLRS